MSPIRSTSRSAASGLLAGRLRPPGGRPAPLSRPSTSIAHGLARGQHQHRRPHAALAQPPARLEAREPREHHVAHDRVVLDRRRHPERILAALGDVSGHAAATAYDAIVLDLRLPGIDGLETCRRVRANEVASPILMLTARDGVEDRVAALDGGSDDYVPKPFAFDELLARLRALARRGSVITAPLLEAGGLRLDPAARRVWRDTTEIELSAKEFGLLEGFMRAPGLVLSRDCLLERA